MKEPEIFKIYMQDNETLVITFSGRLDYLSVENLWNPIIESIKQKQPKKLVVDATNIDYCDGAGIALLQEIKYFQSSRECEYTILNLSQHFQDLFDLIEREQLEYIKDESQVRGRLKILLGQIAFDFFELIRDQIIFLGQVCYQLFYWIKNPRSLRWKDTWKAAANVGPEALIIILLIGFLIGLITSFQSANALKQFGAQSYIGSLVGLGLVREFGPLMTAILLAGRTASSFAAELGTMKINQEVDALHTMGLNPIKFLTLPKIIATVLMTPVMNVFLIFAGIIGCGSVMLSLGFSLQAYVNQLSQFISWQDFYGGVIKSLAFGLVISSVGCQHGLRTESGASAVGYSTTQAVVNSLVMIVIVDGLFAIIYYTLGI
jgi:phospholipid/cholesterol/gamma-HCH transport system permease protein